MNEPAITSFIVKSVTERPYILGSQLGAAVKREFPWFQGLKAYITNYCADQVICAGQRGPDSVYAHVSQLRTPAPPDASPPAHAALPYANPAQDPTPYAPVPTPALPTLQTVAEARQTHPANTRRRATSAWAAFTNPTLADRLALHTTSLSFHIIGRGARILPPLVELPKVTSDEHGQIARAFLEQIAPADRPPFQQIADAPNSWSQWSWHIREFAAGKYSNSWLDFRTQSLRSLLETRLAAVGITPPTTSTLLAQLMESRHRRPSDAFQPQPRPGPGSRTPSFAPHVIH